MQILFSRDDATPLQLEFPSRGKTLKIEQLTSPDGQFEKVPGYKTKEKDSTVEITFSEQLQVPGGKWLIMHCVGKFLKKNFRRSIMAKKLESAKSLTKTILRYRYFGNSDLMTLAS